jgi:hypothetical protein
VPDLEAIGTDLADEERFGFQGEGSVVDGRGIELRLAQGKA